ncbi:hypothetical protein LUX57_08735 [Actinomadura madurae]|uniref:hypothetical protein n=1 Tax=Actinomadura madurae TaxID=1993 RepID=UPI0020D20C61|nr:hypothetical protein [Actinomadura madurae]MCP9965213.1 hypothetical protein [Actinomadura madurae]
MTTADAPAAMALSALTEKKQPPRWISAIRPAGNPAKSSASHPLPVPVAPGSTGLAAAVTSPGAGVLQGREVGVGSERLLLGLGLGEDRLGQLLPEVELEVLDRGGVPGPLELVRDVLDGDLVAGEPGGPVAAVGVRDLLQVELVMADVLQRDQPGQLGRGRCGGLGGHRGQGGGGERQPGEGG